MNRTIIFLFLLLFSSDLDAQTIKTGVVVVGNTPSAVAAAIQSARSGAKTHFIIPGAALNTQFAAQDLPDILQIKNFYLAKDKKNTSPLDSVLSADISQSALNVLLKSILDTTKNLSMLVGSIPSKVEKDGKGWELRMANGQKIKGDLLVDATETLSLSSMIKTDPTRTLALPSTGPFQTRLYRSTIAFGSTTDLNKKSIALLPAGAFLPIGTENFVVIPRSSGNFRFHAMTTGKAAGILAAYCVFFKKSTKSVDIRTAQGELLAFSSDLIPLVDVHSKDPNKNAIQRVVLSGLLKPRNYDKAALNKFEFDTAGTVSSEEIRVPMKEYFSRSQLWFADHKKDVMTLEDVIGMLKFTAGRGDELTREIEEGWAESFNFTSKFNLQKPVSRKEFAVLADRYLQPFNVDIDFQGNLMS